jgi:predicted transcriptional regulator of viral defense system
MGSAFTPNDFFDIGRRDAVDKALSRLTAEGTIRRLARGLYEYPREHAE